MNREISEKRNSDLLYEPIEPLFPDEVPVRKKKAFPMLALAFVVVGVAVATGFGLLSDREQTAQGGGGGIGGTVDSFCESEESQRNEDSEESEEGTSGALTESSEQVTKNETEESRSQTTETSRYEPEESEIITNWEDEIKAESVDLSFAERGDAYISNYTGLEIDASALLDRGFIPTESTLGNAPLVMIIHTHTSEGYLGQTDDDFRGLKSVVSVGEKINERLNSLGISTIHCTVIHDGTDRDAYENARDTIEMMLDIYPSIRYIIDVHRLILRGDDGGLVKTVCGDSDSISQVRLTVPYTEDDRGRENLTLALAMRSELNKYGRRMCMPVAATSLSYNSDLSKYYLLADFGSVGNSLEEAMAAADRFAISFSRVIFK